MPAAPCRCRIELSCQRGFTRDGIQQADITSRGNPPLEDSIRNSPDGSAKSPGAVQVSSRDPNFRKRDRAERQPALQLARTGEALEPASVAHVARVSEVETQPSEEDEIPGNGHPIPSIVPGFTPVSSWVILMIRLGGDP